MNKQSFYFLGFVTLFGFSSIGGGILYYVSDVALIETFYHGLAWYWQILVGLLYGGIAGYAAWWLIQTPLLKPVKEKYGGLMRQFNLNWFDVLFISFCAGYGEEILFRACMQYYVGVIPAAIFFVAIHGYLNPKNWRLSIYGLFMTLIIIGIGYGYDYLGLIFAIAAHFAIDVVLLREMALKDSSNQKEELFYTSTEDEHTEE